MNLLSMKEGEYVLTTAYGKHVKDLGGVRLVNFDAHDKMR